MRFGAIFVEDSDFVSYFLRLSGVRDHFVA